MFIVEELVLRKWNSLLELLKSFKCGEFLNLVLKYFRKILFFHEMWVNKAEKKVNDIFKYRHN